MYYSQYLPTLPKIPFSRLQQKVGSFNTSNVGSQKGFFLESLSLSRSTTMKALFSYSGHKSSLPSLRNPWTTFIDAKCISEAKNQFYRIKDASRKVIVLLGNSRRLENTKITIADNVNHLFVCWWVSLSFTSPYTLLITKRPVNNKTNDVVVVVVVHVF